MVEQIFGENVLINELYKSKGNNSILNLDFETIEKWKKNGNFAFIKSQLSGLHNLKFACVRMEDRCCYYFIPPTEKLSERITSLLRELYDQDKKQPLMKTDIHHASEKIPCRLGELSLSACSLF